MRIRSLAAALLLLVAGCATAGHAPERGTEHRVFATTYGGFTGGAATGTDPFSLMAADAVAFGTAINYTFGSFFQEDFTLGSLTVVSALGGTGAVSFSTAANNLGNGGIISVGATTALNADFAISTALNNNAWATNALTSSYWVEGLCTITGTQTNTFAMQGIGWTNAVAPAGSNSFVIFGVIKSSSTTNLGFSTFNGTAQAFHAGTTAFDLGHQHYYKVGHDGVAHVYYGYVDGVLADSISDAAMTATAMTSWTLYSQSTIGSIQCDKVTAAI